MLSSRVAKSSAVAIGIAVLGGSLGILGAAPASAATSCVAPTGFTQGYVDNSAATYTPAAGTTFVKVTASGGAGSFENGDQVQGGAGALVTSILPVPAGGTFAVSVGQNATGASAGQSGAAASGGAGDTYSAAGTPSFSGGGGGATFVKDGATILLAAGGGGGAGYGNGGGAAATTATATKAAGAVTSGADGGGVGGNQGTGGSATPGTGGTGDPTRGGFSGADGTGTVGGAAFTDPGFSVGGGGGGGGYAGGGGGGVGGFSGAGGAGSSYSASSYTIRAYGAAAPELTFETVVAPVFQSAASASFTQQKSGSFTVCAPSVDAPAITEVGALPAGISFVDNGDGTATFRGTPTGGTGTFPLSLTSTGVAGATTQSFVLTVDPSTSLAVTGTDAAPEGLLALALLVGGAVLVGVRRRLRRVS